MAATGAHGPGARQYGAGQGANPGDRPKGTKRQLIEAFLKALLEDFAKSGKAAIRTARDKSPLQYLRLIAALVPRNWLGDDGEEAQPAPAPVMARKHVMVRSPHRFR